MTLRHVLSGCLLLIALTVLSLAILFFLGFKNYGKHGNWNGLITYDLPMSKAAAENSLLELGEIDSNVIIDCSIADRYSEGWCLIKILENQDTVEYVTRFRGDSSCWAENQDRCNFDLLSITTASGDVITESRKDQFADSIIEQHITIFKETVLLRMRK